VSPGGPRPRNRPSPPAPEDGGVAGGAAGGRRPRSLLARALGYLGRREHGRVELARKLEPHAASADELARLLDELEAKKLLSEGRFAESLARRRGERYGAALVGAELRQRGVAAEVVSETIGELRRTEVLRARAIWKRRFGAAPASDAERLKQMHFLARRGFAAEVVRRIVDNRDDD
jgi:regulatory protein